MSLAENLYRPEDQNVKNLCGMGPACNGGVDRSLEGSAVFTNKTHYPFYCALKSDNVKAYTSGMASISVPRYFERNKVI